MKSGKYLDIFAREAEEILQVLRQGLLALEKEGFAPERVQPLLRGTHTLKGSARLLGLQDLAQVAHRFEDLLRELEREERPLTPALVDLLLVATDAVEALIAEAHSGGEVRVDVEAVLEGLARGEMPKGALRPEAAEIEPRERVAGDTVRASVARLDHLVNLLGEVLGVRGLFEERGRELGGLMQRLEGFLRRLQRAENYRLLKEIVDDFSRFAYQLDRDTLNLHYLGEELHGEALGLRMIPLGTLKDELMRGVRDLSREQGKDVELTFRGEGVEIDRVLLEALRPMLLHMLRNAVDHGIETPAERQESGKRAESEILLEARYERGGVHLRLRDDGRGIDVQEVRRVAVERGLLNRREAARLSDEEALYLILRPGFSTRSFITDISGRGVGLDVVKTNLDRVKGSLTIHSELGLGTEMLIDLPLTLARIKGLLVACGEEVFALPLHQVTEILRLAEEEILVEGGREVVRLRDRTLPLYSLAELLGLPAATGVRPGRRVTALVLSFREQLLACIVTQTLGVDELVVKGMGKQLRKVRFFSGATLRGDGSPALILSVPDLFHAAPAGGTRLRQEFRETRVERGSILVVDDSITTRAMEKNILEAQGYRVAVAISGEEALRIVAENDFDLVVTDIEMPGMSGFDLTRRLRELDRFREVPVVIVTSRSSDEDKRRGIEVGAQAYIVKGSFDQGSLLQTVAALIG